MDAFVWVEGTPYTMAYYDERDIPNYWQYSRHFTLCDAFFSSQAGESLGNHLFAVSAQSGGMIHSVSKLEELEDIRDDPSGFSFPTIVDLLSNANVSWKYYMETVPSAANKAPWSIVNPNPKVFSVWNPLPAFKSVREDARTISNLQSLDQYFRDLERGTLPSADGSCPRLMIVNIHPR